MTTNAKKKYQVRDSAGVDHDVEAAAVTDVDGKVTFWADAAKTEPVAAYVNPPSWGPAQS